MFGLKGSRLNITFLDIGLLDNAIKVYNKPLPCIAKKGGNGRLIYPLFSKKEWVSELIRGGVNLTITSQWRDKTPISITECQFRERFVLLQGSVDDASVMCGLKPEQSDAIRVDIPACIERDGRIIMLDNNDILMSNKLGTKFVMDENTFNCLFSSNIEKACDFDFTVKTRQTVDYEQEFTFR